MRGRIVHRGNKDMRKELFASALGTFALGMAEFIIEGILTNVACGMGVSIPEAGHPISVYALGVCVASMTFFISE